MNHAAAMKLLPAQHDRVVVGHADTGWANHFQLPRAALDLARARNAFDGGGDARDPLLPDDPFYGHGTCTASLLLSGSADVDAARPTVPDLFRATA